MAMLTASDMNDILDAIVLEYQKDPEVVTTALDAAVTAAGSNAITDLGSSVEDMAAAFDWDPIFGTRVRAFFSRLERHIRQRSAIGAVTNLDTFLTYYNTGVGGPWTALQHPDYRVIFNKVKQGSNYPKNHHVYFEILQGVTYTNGLGKLTVTGAGTGTFAAGVAVNTTAYAGGFAQVKASGLAGSGVVTVTGTAFDPATGATQAAVTWTYTLTTNGSFDMAVGTAPANSLIVAVSNITIAAGITAGTIYIEARKPAGRI